MVNGLPEVSDNPFYGMEGNMEYYRLNHSLQLQYCGFLKNINSEFVSGDIYAFDGDLLIAVGKSCSICFSLLDGNVAISSEFALSELDADVISVISKDELTDELMRYILMRMRAMLQIQPYADPYMLSTLRNKLNEQIKKYNVKINDGDDLLPVLSVQVYGIDRNVEFVMAYLMAGNAQADEDITATGFDMHYTKRLMGLMRYDEALDLFLKELDKLSPASMMYTELCMYIGEIYYHLGERERSLAYYRQCDERYVNDINDYYSRVGHSILDDGSGLRGDMIRMYYRCLLNPTYKKSIADKYDRLVLQVEPIYDEYEASCIETGKNEVLGN